MKNNFALFISFLFSSLTLGYSQNIGIQQKNPTEPLEVGGIIFTNQGGIKFPDSTIQTTAARNTSSNPDVAEFRQAILTLNGFQGTFNDNSLGIFDGIPLINYRAAFSLIGSPLQGGGVGSQTFGIKITKNADVSSRDFFEKHFTINSIAEGEIFFIRTNNVGQNEVYKRIEIENVFIKDIEQFQNYNGFAYTDTESIAIEFGLVKIFILTINGEICTCYDFLTRSPCGC